MSDPGYVRLLIEDAKLVVAYGARAGLLADDTLAETVSEAEAKLDSGKPGEIEVHKLAAALNRAVKTIAPVTPLDLGSRWRPNPMTFWRRAGVTIFAALAIVLTLVTGYYTHTYFQANTILSRLNDIRTQNVQEKSERLFRVVLQNYDKLFSSNPAENDAVTVDAYLRSYQDLIALNEDISVYLLLAKDILARMEPVPILGGMLDTVTGFVGEMAGFVAKPGRLADLARPKASAAPPNSANIPEVMNAPRRSETASRLAVSRDEAALRDANPTGDPMIASYLADPDYGGPNSAAAMVGPVSPIEETSAPHIGALSPPERALEMQDNLNYLGQRKNVYLYIAGIPYGMSSVMGRSQNSDLGQIRSDLVSDIYYLQRNLALLATILLPALYGLLGATVFQMRAILNPVLPNPSPERLFFRLALGGFAGLSTALVFGPDAGKVLGSASSYGIGTFGLAFLLGFSVDVFFSILDRLVSAVSQFVSQPRKT